MNLQTNEVVVIGAGLAGCEAALQLACRGIKVKLIERKPETRSEASVSNGFAELVCSNSFRAKTPINAVGMLKEEMKSLGSFFMAAAIETEVPAGGALAVDRDRFSDWFTNRIQNHENIEVVCEELDSLDFDEKEIIIATGPLTGGKLAEEITRLAGEKQLHFYDAIAPIIDAESINLEIAFFQSRYDKGDGADYLNLPFDEEQYYTFVKEVVAAEKVQPREFEKPKFFEGCLPIDIMAERGPKTLAFGPMKPVGLTDPRTGKRPYAVIQLRAENAEKTAYSLVGFQTRLTYPEQERIFRTIPGLEQADFLRLGSVHRNTFINSPELLDAQLRLKSDPRISFAGQISGVEGYVESAAGGLLAGLFTAARLKGVELQPLPEECMIGGMRKYLLTEQDKFQPSNVTHAMLPALKVRLRAKKDRKAAVSKRAEEALKLWISGAELELLKP